MDKFPMRNETRYPLFAREGLCPEGILNKLLTKIIIKKWQSRYHFLVLNLASRALKRLEILIIHFLKYQIMSKRITFPHVLAASISPLCFDYSYFKLNPSVGITVSVKPLTQIVDN